MAITSHAATLPSGRGRKILIALLLLLLILLPLYLWPLRGGLAALPWVSLTGGVPTDPRNAAALAGIPGDVWDALMNQAPDHPPAPGPRSLTMITEHEGEPGASLDPDSIGSLAALLSADDPPPNPFVAVTDLAGGEVGGGDPSLSSTPGQFGSWLSDEGQGIAGSWPGGGGAGAGGIDGHRRGFPVLLTNLPFSDSEPNVRGPVLIFAPEDPIAPHPTPEPGTIALIGVNGILLAMMARKHRRCKKERSSTR